MRSECKEGLYVACIDVESMLQQRYAFMIMMNINSYPLVPVMRSSSIPFYSFQSSCITTYICDGLRREHALIFLLGSSTFNQILFTFLG